jgi:hypothetical protein
LGGAVLEDLKYDDNGQFLTGSLADYLLPTATDFPNLRCVVLDNYPSPINPLGAKGAGEGGIIAAGRLHGERGGERAAKLRRSTPANCHFLRLTSGTGAGGSAQGCGVSPIPRPHSRHSGALAKRANPESRNTVAPASGFRVRAFGTPRNDGGEVLRLTCLSLTAPAPKA